MTDTEVKRCAKDLSDLLTNPDVNVRGLDRIEELREYLAREFAQRHGWTIADIPFSARSLIAGHLLAGDRARGIYPFNCFAGPDRLPVALVHHVENTTVTDEQLEFAAANGLTMEIDRFPSWALPGRLHVAVFTRAKRGHGK
jgi:hypothetical protein